MLRWVILSVVVVVLAAAATFLVQTGTTTSTRWRLPVGLGKKDGPLPRVEVVGSLTYDFGALSTQKTRTHKWIMKNVGEGDLEIWLAGSSCTCTIAKLKDPSAKEIIKPGASTEIELEWKTKEMVGQYVKDATIATNDPTHPQVKLVVSGLVHPPVVLMPRPQDGVLPIGVITNDQLMTQSMAVYSPERPELKVTRITSSRPDMVVAKVVPLTPQECEQLKTKAGNRLVVDIKPGLALGTFREELILETDHPDQPKVQLTLVGTVTGPISVMPTHLRMVTVNGKQGGTGNLTLMVREGRSTSFEITHKPEQVQVSIATNDTPSLKGRYRVTVTVPPGTPAGLIDDVIVLKTDHPKVSELKIPVNIVVGSG